MNEFFGKLRGAVDKRSEAELEQEMAKAEIGPDTPVWHVIGSERYHTDAHCPKLDEEEKTPDENQEVHHGIGRLFGEMKELNRRVQQNEIYSILKLNETGKLELCPDCDKKKIRTTPKDPYAAR